MIPVLEMTFSGVAGDPWQGHATVRFQGDASAPFAVREGLSGKQRGEIRWYIEQFMDLPEGGNLQRALGIEHQFPESLEGRIDRFIEAKLHDQS